MGKVILEVRDLKTKYVTRFHEDVYAVDGVSFKIEEGKSLGVAGESGCGKSTLALSMMGYYFPPLHYISGDIIIDGKNISGMDPDSVRKTILGTEIAYIPQAAMNALNPTQKIIRFVEDVIRAHDPKADKKQIRELASTPRRKSSALWKMLFVPMTRKQIKSRSGNWRKPASQSSACRRKCWTNMRSNSRAV